MRLVVLIPTMELAGAQRVLVTLANTLASLEHDVHLVCLTGRGPLVDELSPAVEYHQLDAARALPSIGAFRRLLRTLRPVAVISVMQGGYVSLAATAGMRDRPVLIAGHHDRPRSISSFGSPARTSLVTASMAAAYRGVDSTVVVCEDSQDELAEMLHMAPERFVVLPNPVDLEELDRLSSTGEAHPLLTSGAPSMVMVASHTPKKKISSAIALLSELPEHNLVVLGDGALRPELERQAAELGVESRLSLAGVWTNPFPSMLAADVALSASTSEALPLGLIEAVVLGARVVSTDSGSGTREILRDYDAAVIADSGAEADLAEAVRRATATAPRADQVDAKRQTYSAVAVANRYLDLVAELMGERR